MIKDLTYVIATRKGSKRIKNKNVRKFGKLSLLEIKLKQIRRVDKKANIFLSSNCKKSLKIGLKYGATINKRPTKYASDYIPMRDVYKYLAKKVVTKNVCYLHVTSPFLKDKTLKKALRFTGYKKNYDSIATVTEVKEYLWFKNKAINYNPNNHPKSQSLPKYFALNFAVNIISTEKMRKEGRIVGKRFFPLILKFPESLDIDNKWQFEIGEVISKSFKY